MNNINENSCVASYKGNRGLQICKYIDISAYNTSDACVVQKTCHKFSAMALNQAHEQENALIKGEGGAVGLTNNPAALRRG